MAEKKRALVVDDEEGIREFIREVLEEEGWEVLLAEDGVQAWALATVPNRLLHVIISDIQMPKKDGIVLLKELKSDARLSSIPVILLTGIREKAGISFTKEGIGDTLGTEPSAYLEKPVTPQELLKAVRSLA